MSDKSHDQAHEDHTGPVKTPKQMLMLSFASFIIPVFIIIGLVYYVTSANKTAPGGDTERAVAERIQKVGTVEVRDANRPMKAGQEVYKAQCAACHATGAAGAPKFGDAAAWGPRIKTGFDALMNSALKGKGAIKTKRSVLKRFERVDLLRKRGQFQEGQRVIGLPKTKPEE